MLSIITGGQRQGKSCFAVKKIKRYLIDTKRPIYSNLPLHPDKIALQLVKLNGNPINRHDNMIPILERIHLFRKFQNLRELKEWYTKNFFWCNLHTRRLKGRMIPSKIYYDNNTDLCDNLIEDNQMILPDEFDDNINYNRWEMDCRISTDERLFYPLLNVMSFWTISKSNCIHFYDEVYQIFSKIDQGDRGADMKAHRKKLLTYSKQHGHYKDDMYLITHDPGDVDDIVRKSVGFTYECFNALDKNIIDDAMMKKYPFISLTFKGMKYPVFFFMIYGYEKNAKTATDFWRIRPKQRDFECYDSFSMADGIEGKVTADDGAKSADIGRSQLKMFGKWFYQSWPNLLIITVGISLAVIILRGLGGMVGNNKGVKLGSASTEKEVETVPEKQVVSGVKESLPVEEKVKPKLTGMTPTCIYYDDGLKIEKGGIYEYQGKVFDVLKISKSFVTLALGGKEFRVAVSGLR